MVDIKDFAPIPRYDGEYLISRTGEVYSVKRGRVIAPFFNKKGYARIKLCKDGTRKNERIHRLVAEVFLENPEGKEQVNHIDGNKKNNSVDNLEWCTNEENMEHAIRTGLIKRGRKKK